MKLRALAALLAALLLAPSLASAAFYDSASQAQSQVNALSQQQLDSLNGKVFTDAWITAKVIGYDRSDIDQLKADVQQLKAENAQLRAQLGSRPATVPAPVSSDDARITALEVRFASLQDTLGTVVKLLTMVLAKMQ